MGAEATMSTDDRPLAPKVSALRDALRRLDACPPYSHGHAEARGELTRVAHAAGFDMRRAVEDWARYTVAVAESVAEKPEPEDEQGALAL